MTEKTETAKAEAAPKEVHVQMDSATLQALGELMMPCTLWARATGAPDPSPGDVVNMAILVLHGQVCPQTTAGEVAPTAMH